MRLLSYSLERKEERERISPLKSSRGTNEDGYILA